MSQVASAPVDRRLAPVLAGTTVLGIVIYVALDIVAQSLPPHYSPLSFIPVSD